MIRVLLVDDHDGLRDGLRELLAGCADLEVVGAAADGDEAGRLAAVARPDVVLMDLRMPRADGVAGTRAVRQAAPSARVVVLTALSDTEHLLRALDAGAEGYLLKDAPARDVVSIVRAAVAGELDRQRTIAELRDRRSDQLSERDVELLRLTVTGSAPRRGSVALELAGLYRRIGVRDADEAAIWARRHGVA